MSHESGLHMDGIDTMITKNDSLHPQPAGQAFWAFCMTVKIFNQPGEQEQISLDGWMSRCIHPAVKWVRAQRL